MTRGAGVEVRVSANYDRWMNGFGHLGSEMTRTGATRWQQATDVFFDRSQQYAHVLTAEMKSSGSAEVELDGQLKIIGRIVYDSDHAVFEEHRGGQHAFITRAWEATEVVFSEALPGMWGDVVTSWG